MPEQLITVRQADAAFARYLTTTGTQTRTALDALIPKGSGAIPSTSVAQIVRQRGDGSWGNPVRNADVAGRIYVAAVDSSRTPKLPDGVQPSDVLVSRTGIYLAAVTATTVTWEIVASGSSPGTPPTDPGGTTPTPTIPGDTSTPSPTSRPYALLGTSGTWTTTGGSTLVQALSDQAVSSAAALPDPATGGVSLILDMSNFAHTVGNDLTVTLWGATSAQPGDVIVSVGRGSTQYVSAKTRTVGTSPANLAFTWTAADQLSLPVETWRDAEVTVRRNDGGFTALADLTMQSFPPATNPTDPRTNPSGNVTFAPSSVWYSLLGTAPVAKANTAIAGYVRQQITSAGGMRLDCYADGPVVWMVDAKTPRVNVTPKASNRGAVTLMHTTDGKGALDGVPIPADAVPPANTFKTATIVCQETAQVWELLGLTKSGATWSAEWGGRIDKYTASTGAFPTDTGFTGSGLAVAACAVRLDEVRAALASGTTTNAIPHALGLNLNYDSASSKWCAPATRSDGASTDVGAPLMGQRVRLKASYNVDAANLTPVGKMVAKALQTYGAVVMGGSDKPGIICESGQAEQARTGIDPWGAVLGGKTVTGVLAGIPWDQLEAVSPGWGTPGWKAESDPVTTPPTTPTTPTTPTPSPNSKSRVTIYINPDVKWLSGASCKGIEKSTEGMGSAYAQWRGEPCYMGRTWADQGGKPDQENYYYSRNDWTLSSLFVQWNNWHASIDEGPGFFGSTENMADAAAGKYVPRWTATVKRYREWWVSRRDPKKVNAFLSPAHEMNGSWYPWSVNSGNYQQFITAWKRFREVQLRHFPEAILCFNANRDSVGAGMDWRKMVPGYAEGKVHEFVDVGGVDYYNMDPNSKTAAEWDSHILQYDGWGGPKGLERHRQFWESCGLAMIIPEWSNNITQGDSPIFATKMNEYMRKWAGTGAGQIAADALFNLSQGYSGKYAVMGDEVGSPKFAAEYQRLVWGK